MAARQQKLQAHRHPGGVLPVLDENYDLVRTERRVYDEVVTVTLDDDGTRWPRPPS